ncbi:MAG: stage V sporulation protein SpoVM [Clostridia bacterium]|nr:stage V sporulation protein SpoVM [Clostridia bacterium]
MNRYFYQEVKHMKIVVVKSPRALKSILKMIFNIKES